MERNSNGECTKSACQSKRLPAPARALSSLRSRANTAGITAATTGTSVMSLKQKGFIHKLFSLIYCFNCANNLWQLSCLEDDSSIFWWIGANRKRFSLGLSDNSAPCFTEKSRKCTLQTNLEQHQTVCTQEWWMPGRLRKCKHASFK